MFLIQKSVFPSSSFTQILPTSLLPQLCFLSLSKTKSKTHTSQTHPWITGSLNSREFTETPNWTAQSERPNGVSSQTLPPLEDLCAEEEVGRLWESEVTGDSKDSGFQTD